MQQKKNRRGREYLNDFRRDVNGSYLYQGSYRRYTGSMPYAKLRGLLWALCGGALAALAAAGMVPAPGAMQQFYVLLPYAGRCGCCGCFCRRAHHPGGGLYRRIRLRARRVKDLAP